MHYLPVQAFLPHPQLLEAALVHGILAVVDFQRGSRHDAIPTLAAAAGLEQAVLTPPGELLDTLLAAAYTAHKTRPSEAQRLQGLPPHLLAEQLMLGRIGAGAARPVAAIRLLQQWPFERVLAGVRSKLSSSNNHVVLGALLALQHLQDGPAQQEQQEGGNLAAAEQDTTAADAVAAAVRQMAQAGDMAELVNQLQEVAVGMAQQHQTSRDTPVSSRKRPRQQQL
jgi:hypothetical protein